MSAFFLLIASISVHEMFIVIFCLFDFFLSDLFFVLVNFGLSYFEFLSVLGARLLVFLFLFTEDCKLVFCLVEGIFYIFSTVWIKGILLDATWLTARDLDLALGSS